MTLAPERCGLIPPEPILHDEDGALYANTLIRIHVPHALYLYTSANLMTRQIVAKCHELVVFSLPSSDMQAWTDNWVEKMHS